MRVCWYARRTLRVVSRPFVTVAFIALTIAGLYRLPRPDGDTFRAPGHPVTPILFLVLLATILLLLAAGRPVQAALGVAVVAMGIPVYRLLIRARIARQVPQERP